MICGLHVYELPQRFLLWRVNAILDLFLAVIAATVVVLIIVIVYQFVLVPSRRSLQCPVCGSTSVEAIPKLWVTSPGESTDLVLYPSRVTTGISVAFARTSGKTIEFLLPSKLHKHL
jgi:hypothetical protein